MVTDAYPEFQDLHISVQHYWSTGAGLGMFSMFRQTGLPQKVAPQAGECRKGVQHFLACAWASLWHVATSKSLLGARVKCILCLLVTEYHYIVL